MAYVSASSMATPSTNHPAQSAAIFIECSRVNSCVLDVWNEPRKVWDFSGENPGETLGKPMDNMENPQENTGKSSII